MRIGPNARLEALERELDAIGRPTAPVGAWLTNDNDPVGFTGGGGSDPGANAERLRLLAEIASEYVAMGDFRAAQTALSDAWPLFEEVEDERIVAQAALLAGLAFTALKVPKRARTRLDQAARLFESLGDDDAHRRASMALFQIQVELGEAPKTNLTQQPHVNTELEAAIFEAPDDPDAYEVYGDWLQSKGDPLGELISVHLALAASTTAPPERLKQAEALLLAQYEDVWFGDLKKQSSKRTVRWSYGFFDSIELDVTSEFQYASLHTLRAARFLRGLRLNVLDGPATAIVQQMASVGISPLLEELELRFVDVDFGPRLQLPSLKQLTILSPEISRKNLASIAASDWPNLEELTLDFLGSDIDVPSLEPLLLGKVALPKLHRLEIVDRTNNNQLSDLLARSPLSSHLVPYTR